MPAPDAEQPRHASVEDLERRLVESERRLSHTSEELETLRSVLNHDMRSPLVSVMGFVAELGFLRDEMFARWSRAEPESAARGPLEREFLESFSYLQCGAVKMGHLLDVLSELAAHHRRPLSVAAVDLAALVASVASSLAEPLPGGALEIAELPTVSTDRAALGEALGYLLDNAVHHRRPLVAPRVVVDATVDDEQVQVRITDNGRGIAERDHLRIFRPMVRIGPTSDRGKGTGLSHARAILRRLGGDLSMVSDLAWGSTFTVSLPARPPRFA